MPEEGEEERPLEGWRGEAEKMDSHRLTVGEILHLEKRIWIWERSYKVVERSQL